MRRRSFLLGALGLFLCGGAAHAGAAAPVQQLLGAADAAAPAAASASGEAEVRRLGSELAGFLRSYRWRSAQWGVLVVSLDRGDTLFAMGHHEPMAPASNLKLLTTAAALGTLGPEYRFRTYLLTDGVEDDGVLVGDLVLYGTGDPGISDRFYDSKTAVFEELADTLLARGIHTVRGDLVGDASFLPGPIRPEGWDPEDLNDHFAAGVSALSFNENVVTLQIQPASQGGVPPTVRSIPDHAGLEIDNRALTMSTRSRGRVGIARLDPSDPILVEGRMQVGGRDAWRQMTVTDPARFSLSVFRAVLEERGIVVEGRSRVVDAPSASVVGVRRLTAPRTSGRRRTRILARHISPPLRDYLAVVNKRSNNLFAELTFRTVGRVGRGSGAPEASARAVADALTRMGADVDDVVQLDGSGLAAGNRVSPSAFVDVLRAVSESPHWAEFWHTLPEAGRRRELGRMYRTPAAGNLRAKTGTIERVSALTGVVQSADGERIAFSILVNGTPSTSAAKDVENRIGARLASFTRGADAALSVVQLPPPPIPTDAGGPARHQVARGENMSGIAQRYGLTLEDLLRANPDVEPRRLQAGEWITIPSGR